MDPSRIRLLAALLLVAPPVPSPAAEPRVTFDSNQGADATPAFKFRTVPPPASKDAGVVTRLSIAAGEPDANAADLEALTDGALPATDDEPGSCFFFAPGTDGGRLVADLGEAREVRRVGAYSWHRDVRAPQVWTLWASDGAAAGFDPKPGKDLDPAKAGWKRLAAVDTRPAEGRPGGQYGSSVSGADGAPLGTFRWLLFEVSRTETRTPFGNTFLGEIDIDDGKEHAPPVAPAATAGTGGYEISIDADETPELKEWIEKKLRPALEAWYPKIVEMLPSEGYRAPRRFSVTFRKDMSGVAHTAGRRVVCAGPWFRANLEGEAAGAVVHELVHVAQQYRSRGNPGWLVEGLADWIRWFRYEPESLRPRPDPRRAKYTDSYRTTAAFLDWLVRTRDESVIRKLNAAMREGKYAPDLWKEVGGKPIDDLWADYIATLSDPTFRTVDLDLGESARVDLPGGAPVSVKLVDLAERRCELRGAVREATVTVEVDGETVRLVSALYNLPRAVGRVQIDCPVTRGYTEMSSKDNVWALEKAARLRLWPAGSPWIRPGTFAWPVSQRWFASDTQMGNDPCYVNACDVPGEKEVYYHYGLDFGGAEGLVKVSAATDGIVASRAGDVVPGDHPPQVQPRRDVVYLRDDRGWYWRYSHLKSIDPTVRLGERVRIGDPIGILGKEGGSGGWSHLHLDVSMPQPSGRYGIADAYAFAFQAWRERAKPRLIAVARPHLVAWAGETVVLDAGRSWHAEGPGRIRSFEWRLTDGRVLSGSRVEVRYDSPGHWSEVLKVTEVAGEVSYDIAVVQTFDRKAPVPVPPAMHVASWPTEGIRTGDEVVFKARTFGVRPDEGEEAWDFGDESPPATTRSDGNADQHAPEGYAATAHRFERAGDFIVSVRRTSDRGETATGRVWVRVAPR